MATGGTAAPLAMANPPHSLLDQDSNVSSPLSEVEDRDADPDDMDIDTHSNHTDGVDPLDSGKDRAQGPAHPPRDDSESNLSDIETNDSEAETERLYDTPRKNNSQAGNMTTVPNLESKQSPLNPNRTYQRSPSKLQSQVQARIEAESGDDDNDDLTDERHDADDEDKGSIVYNEGDSDEEEGGNPGKPAQMQRNKSQESHIVASSTLAGSLSDNSSADSRKRKRSPVAEQTSSNQPPRKRAGSIPEIADDSSSLSKVMSEDVAPDNSTGNKSAEQTADEEDEDITMKDTEEVADSVEKPPSETTRPKKSKRNSTKKRKSSEEDVGEAHNAEGPDATGTHTAEEHAQPEVDEEAEAAHRNEEESKEQSLRTYDLVATDQSTTVEKKRNAFDHLSSIEKNFAILRDRLYEERLAQLNEEEAMLTSDNPTHPEYLAMMQCIDSRRAERLRVADLEYRFNMTALDDWAVARRAQILTQYYQSARETRERYIDDLGREWYEIQHERRRVANPIPDYGFRFPKTKLEQKRHAVAHSKEVSILAGIAQHQGFPAAPDMKGATSAELEEDFEAMARARQGTQPIAVAQRMQPALQEYAAAPFGQSLGPAGQEYIENHPWANPKHPSHGPASRRHSHSTYAGPPALMGHARTPHPPAAPVWFANGQLNGDSGRRHPTVAADPEPAHVRKAVEVAKSKREAVV